MALDSPIEKLSSRVGDRTERSNKKVASLCLAEPGLLGQIALGLSSGDDALVGDCAEVMTKVAQVGPELVAPFAEALARNLDHRKARARWESMHALALVASLRPDVVAANLGEIARALRGDRSVIVRDHATTALGGFALTSKEAVDLAFPLLVEMLYLWEGKQAHHALRGLGLCLERPPELAHGVERLALQNLDSPRPITRQAARLALGRAREASGESESSL